MNTPNGIERYVHWIVIWKDNNNTSDSVYFKLLACVAGEIRERVSFGDGAAILFPCGEEAASEVQLDSSPIPSQLRLSRLETKGLERNITPGTRATSYGGVLYSRYVGHCL